MRLELVPLPTSDVERSKEFYVDGMVFHLDHDVEPGNEAWRCRTFSTWAASSTPT
jgi:catechol 2,3-dioxygenase-like lactoylglutathione lyase family enzyme